jgi:hypothetical protein
MVKSFSDGVFNKQLVFTGMIEVMIEKVEHEQSNKGLQSMKYSPAFDEWAHKLCCISPKAYRSFVHHFGGCSERSFRQIRSKQPGFDKGISNRILERVQQYINDYGYPLDGPLSLSVDDTKLHPSLSPFFDNKQKKWFLVGSTDGALEVSNINNVQDLLKSAEKSTASKLQLWALSIPLPSVPPLVLAAKLIPSKISSSQLAEFEKQILDILLPAGFQIVALGSDGTSVEQDSRRASVHSGYAKVVSKQIPSPEPVWLPIKITMLQVHGMLLSVIQDAKHLQKTCQNNLMSGARMLVLGGFTVFYKQIQDMALDFSTSPLYLHGVKKLDRQDD